MKYADPQFVHQRLARFRRHLLLGVALLLAAVTTGAGLVLLESHRAQEAIARQAASNVAQTLALNVAARIKLVDSTLRSTLQQIDHLQRHGPLQAAEVDEILHAQQALVPELESLRVTDAEGRVLAVDGGPALSVAERDDFRFARASPSELAVSEPAQGPGGKWGLLLARARQDANGRFAGIVYAVLPTASFLADFRRADLGRQGAATLRSQSLRLIARHSPRDGGVVSGLGGVQVSTELRHALAADPARGSLVSRTVLDGIERVTAYEAVPGQQMLMLAGLSTEEFYTHWRRQALVFVALVLGLTALIVAAAWFVYRAQARQVRARHEITQLATERGALLDNELVPMVRLKDRREVWHNRALAELFGYAPGELSGQSARAFYPDDAAFERAGKGYARMPKSGRFRAQLQMARKDGQRLWIDLSGTNLPNGESLWMMVDITAVKQREEQARHLALHDALTGLPNRHLLQDRLDFLLRDAERQKTRLAVCYLDLDGFKAVNDSRGHDAGDALLRVVAQRLAENLRGNDVVARIGGDEFVVVFSHLGSSQDEEKAVERLLARFDGPFVLPDGSETRVGASIGVALYPEHGREAGHLVTLADQAMLAGKRAGKGRWILHQPVAPAA